MKFRRMSFVLCMLIFLVTGISVCAQQREMRVSLGEEGAGIELAVYQVADEENREFVLYQDYQGVKVDFTKLTDNDYRKVSSEKLYERIVAKGIQPKMTGTANEDGDVSFHVDFGAYVVVKVSEKGTMLPVLVTVSESNSGALVLINPKFHVPEDPEGPEDEDPGDKEPGDKEPGDKDPGGKEPGDKEPGGKEPGGKDPGDKNPVHSAKTGDSANVLLWSAVLVAALAGIAVVVKKNHGRK